MEPPPTRISDHAIIGDGRSAALVARDGAIDWLCWPEYDSPSIFAHLLDPAGGSFTVAPRGRWHVERRYLPDTNVLETRFRSAAGAVTVTDCMPLPSGESRALLPEREILRIVRCEQGEVALEVAVDPRPDYGTATLRWRDAGRLGFHLEAGRALFVLQSEPPLHLAERGGVHGTLALRAGQTARLSLTHSLEAPAVIPPLGERAEQALRDTVDAWRTWTRRVRYHGPFRDAVVRSALALKLLAHTATGAIVAAPTTSLPERAGAALNWDYRYCWLRDSSMTVRALFGLGFEDEARAFVGWLLHSTRLTRPRLRVMYDVYGRGVPRERDLDWEGYAESRPVRIGNGARDQLQLDVYGEVMDAVAQLVRQGIGVDRETGRMLTDFGRYVCRHWREPDEGIWEPRSGRRHNTYSKALCWVALHRLIELHERGHVPRTDLALLHRERAAIREEIEAKAWSESRGSYTAVFGGRDVHAELLQLPWYGYVPTNHRRMIATYRRIERDLGAGRGLLYRYRAAPDWREGAFGICGFWAAEYLALGGGTEEEAQCRISGLLRFANDVGLFSEEVDPDTGDALGNFPQAFTHIGLVNACLTLERRLAGREALTHHRALPHADEVPVERSAEHRAARDDSGATLGGSGAAQDGSGAPSLGEVS